MDNFIGYIDEIKIYNVALSDNDISVMYDKESNGVTIQESVILIHHRGSK